MKTFDAGRIRQAEAAQNTFREVVDAQDIEFARYQTRNRNDPL